MTNDEIKKLCTDEEILTLTMIGEARGEPIEGLLAVGSVIRNRVNALKKSVKDVCLAKYQFSCWNTNDPNRKLLEALVIDKIRTQREFSMIGYVAAGIYKNILRDNTSGAQYYMTLKLYNSAGRPEWSSGAKDPSIYGHHIFFKV